jgi:hypothetical protein
VSATPPPDLAAIRSVLSRATGTGWEAAYRQDVGVLLDEVERLRELLLDAGWPALAIAKVSASGAAQERAAVVAWLRSLQPHNTEVVAVYLQMLADVIERGGHRREEAP